MFGLVIIKMSAMFEENDVGTHKTFTILLYFSQTTHKNLLFSFLLWCCYTENKASQRCASKLLNEAVLMKTIKFMHKPGIRSYTVLPCVEVLYIMMCFDTARSLDRPFNREDSSNSSNSSNNSNSSSSCSSSSLISWQQQPFRIQDR
jgi:hypothetical protein